METDKRLETLCEEFTELEEAEKDYILGISSALAFTVSVQDSNPRKGAVPLPVSGDNWNMV